MIHGVLALALAAGEAAASAPGPDIEALLARPLSPGLVVLLGPHAVDPRVQERWALALRDQRAEVRGAAAKKSQLADAAVRTLAQADVTSWRALLGAFEASGHELDRTLVLDALEVPALREATAWHVVEPKACRSVITPLIAASLPEPDDVPDPRGSETLVLVFDSESLACVEDADPVEARSVRPSDSGEGRIEEPKKIRDVRPVYPPGARQAGLQGIVVFEAALSPEGCVRRLRRIAGADPALDGAAFRAVSRWRYTPTLLDGRPVPVTMLLSVAFRISR